MKQYEVLAKCMYRNVWEKNSSISYIFSLYHHQVVLLARISLTPSRHPSILSITPGKSSRLHLVSVQS